MSKMSAENAYIKQLKVRILVTIYRELNDYPEALSFLLVLISIVLIQKIVIHNSNYIEIELFHSSILVYKCDYYFIETLKNGKKYILINPSEKALLFFNRDSMPFFDAWIKRFGKSFNSSCKEHFNNFNYERNKKGLKSLTLKEVCSK